MAHGRLDPQSGGAGSPALRAKEWDAAEYFNAAGAGVGRGARGESLRENRERRGSETGRNPRLDLARRRARYSTRAEGAFSIRGRGFILERQRPSRPWERQQ